MKPFRPGTLPEPAFDARESFALLQAAPCRIDYSAADPMLDWTHPELAEAVFHTPRHAVPRTVDELCDQILHDAARQRQNAISRLTWDGACYELNYQIMARNGQAIWIEERGQRVSGDGASAHDVMCVFTEVSSRRARDQEQARFTQTDSLTQLWTRERLRDGLDYLIPSAERYGRDFAYIVLRVSNLPDINTAYGYDAGDRLLDAIAGRLRADISAPDLLARVGGISFGIALADCAAEDIAARAQSLQALLTNEPYMTPAGEIYATLFAGGLQCSGESISGFDILLKGREALEESERRGDFYTLYTDDLTPSQHRTVQPKFGADDIIGALNARRISLAYQPIVHTLTRDPHHYECLLRLTRDDGEVVSAGEFILAAERLGHVHLLDRRALEIASETLLNYPDVHLALNVSAATVKNESASEGYLRALRALGPYASRLTIELTETVALEDPALAGKFSMTARALGCRFAIDDFGAGYTSFQNLMAIEADEIKIDGSFIRDLSRVHHKQVFVRMMVDLAQTFSVKTVAEMVSSREDAELLSRFGVDFLQGFMFGIPGPAPEMGESLTRRSRA